VNIDKYISELLYSHDCVIVPDFGGFVANYSPARIHPTQHTFSPPSKNISFNKNLKNNDGLLANAIATAEKITFAEAARIITKYVDSCVKTLKSGKKFSIENVGTLYFDVENNLQFEPDAAVNYLLDSFGLTAFQSPAIKRGVHIEHEAKFVDRAPVPAKKKINIGKYVAMAIGGAAVVFAMVWIPLKTDILKNANYSALNPFQAEQGKYIANKGNTSEITSADLSEETEEHGTGSYYLDLTGSGDTVTVAAEAPFEAVADTTAVVQPVAASSSSFDYHVVGGCFSIYENAENYVAELREQNINASIIGKNRAGLHVVSLGDYANKEEAMTALYSARGHNPNAWLLQQ